MVGLRASYVIQSGTALLWPACTTSQWHWWRQAIVKFMYCLECHWTDWVPPIRISHISCINARFVNKSELVRLCCGFPIVFICVAWVGFNSMRILNSCRLIIASGRIPLNDFRYKYYSRIIKLPTTERLNTHTGESETEDWIDQLELWKEREERPKLAFFVTAGGCSLHSFMRNLGFPRSLVSVSLEELKRLSFSQRRIERDGQHNETWGTIRSIHTVILIWS